MMSSFYQGSWSSGAWWDSTVFKQSFYWALFLYISIQYYGHQKTPLFYAGAQNYETTYTTVSCKDLGFLGHHWLLERIMGYYWLKVPTILMGFPKKTINKQTDTKEGESIIRI